MRDHDTVLWLLDQDGWLEHYDPDGGDPAIAYPTGTYGVTSNPHHALRFADAASALAFWGQTSTRTPLRPDGEPNRPLTTFTVDVQRLSERRTWTATLRPELRYRAH